MQSGILRGRRNGGKCLQATTEESRELLLCTISLAGSSFNLISEWIDKIGENTDIDQLTLALVGNKSDLERQVPEKEASLFAEQHAVLF